MKITATIQARMGSNRLPGKVLKQICGKPMLQLQIERIQKSILIDEVIIATSRSEKDNPIEELARSLKIACFRGSENDVLGRIAETLRKYDIGTHVEFMGDSPMPDPMVIDAIIGFYLKNKNNYDYVTNSLKTTYPPGMEVSVYPAKILLDAEKHAGDLKLREHVGMHIFQHPERYRIHNIEAPSRHYMPQLYLEVDTAEDFEVISKIFERFYPDNPGFSLSQIIDYIKTNPELAKKNAQVERRWKAFRKD